MKVILEAYKKHTLPISMIIGLVLHPWIGQVGFVTPYLIFVMLLITYSKLSLKELKLEPLHLMLLAIQLLGSVAVYLLLKPVNSIVAQGVMICILAPTATSSVVITKLLGGNIASLATYTLLCNLAVAIFAPWFFPLVNPQDQFSFWTTFASIGRQVGPLLITPFVLALALRRFWPAANNRIQSLQSISLYLWSAALMIVTAKMVLFIRQQDSAYYLTYLVVAALALVVCLAQFITGRRLGSRYNNTVAGGQALGQKNTILAIWMAQTFLNPISAIGPGSYVLWQNIVNSYQLWRKNRLDEKQKSTSV